MAYALGHLHPALVEVGVHLGLGQLNWLGIRMSLGAVLLQPGKLLLDRVVLGAMVVVRSLRTLPGGRDADREHYEGSHRTPLAHRSDASAAGALTACTEGLSSVPEMTYDCPPERSNFTARLRLYEAVPVTLKVLPPACILQSFRLNVPSCRASFPANLENVTGVPLLSRLRWRNEPPLQVKSAVPPAELPNLDPLNPASVRLYSPSTDPVAQLSCIKAAT